MGLLSGIRDVYRGLDRSVTKAEKKALEIVVPKRDRKDARELAHFLDRFAGMIASDAPNTESAPSFVHETLAPFREARKNPTPWNVYAAGGSAMALFPWGTKLHAGPEEWDSARIPGGRIRNMGSQENPRYHWVPPDSDIPDLRTYLNVNMHDPDRSYVDMFRRTDPAPGGVVNDMLDPLINRFNEYGSRIDAYPVNTKVAGTLLGARARNKNMVGDSTTDMSADLVQAKMRDLRDLWEAESRYPGSGGPHARVLRSMLSGDQHTPRDFQGALMGHKRWMNRKRLEGDLPELGPDYDLPEYARGETFKNLMGLVGDESYGGWGSPGIRASIGEPVPAGRPRLESDPGGGMYAHEHEAASQHSATEWDQLDTMGRITAAERVRDGLPARWENFRRVENEARHWWTDHHPGEDPFDAHNRSDQLDIIREYQATQRGDIQVPGLLSASRRLLPGQNESARDSTIAARHQHTADEWNDLSRGERDEAILRRRQGLPPRQSDYDRLEDRAEIWFNNRTEGDPYNLQPQRARNEIIREYQQSSVEGATNAIMDAIGPTVPTRHERRVQNLEALVEPPDITERAMRMARAHPEYHRWSDQERRAEARRIRGQLAHAERSGDNDFVTRETFEWEEAARAHDAEDPSMWHDLTHTEQREAVERARRGLPYIESYYRRLEDRAAENDSRYSPGEFMLLSPTQRMSRTARYLGSLRRES